MLGGSTLLLFAGLPVAFTFIAVNIAGALIWLGGEVGVQQLARNSVVSITSFSLTPIPLFILMGEVLFHTGIAVKVNAGGGAARSEQRGEGTVRGARYERAHRVHHGWECGRIARTRNGIRD